MGYSEFLKNQLGPENEYYEDIDEIYKAGGRAKILPIIVWSTSTPSSGTP